MKKPNKSVFQLVIITSILWCITAAPNVGLGNDSAIIKGISIDKITIGEETTEIGKIQLIEVAIKNSSPHNYSGVVKLLITLPNHNIITFGNKKVKIKGETITRALIPYPIHKKRPGDYTVSAKLFSKHNKVIAQNVKDDEQYFFATDPKRKRQPPRRRGAAATQAAKAEALAAAVESLKPVIEFEPADLTWKNVYFVNRRSILRGEPAMVHLELVNAGGDIVTNVEYSLFWYLVQRPKKKMRFFKGKHRVIAPGERKLLEIPLTIPETEQKGKYQIVAVVDPKNEVKELSDDNNNATAESELIFSDIALDFPGEAHSFAEDGLFLFEWRSTRYNQFKVQISADSSFYNVDEMFELPKGNDEDAWTPEHSIKPLSGEMPALALALMKSNEIDHLFWRVLAKNADGATTVSESRQFYIDLKPE